MQLKNQLQTTKQGNLSMNDYVDKLTTIADNLVLASKAVNNDAALYGVAMAGLIL